ncbi:MAG: hypothetical protein JSW34_06540 [Candidatus Zixiibacteriota bacterium]|nr:MAG: hypothetical protein JSW34_06540 [candidate division Zixibacteria bacterium]
MSLASRIARVAVLCLLIVSSAAATSDLPPPENIRITFYPELNNEEQVFLCPVDSNVVIANWRDFRLGYRQIGIGRSIDGGQTWTDSLISVDMQYFGSQARQSDPTMTVDRFGNFYMSALDYDGVGGSDGSVISFYKSTDKGISWTGPVPNVSEIVDPEIFEDKQFFTADRTGGVYDANIYCSWTRFPNPNRIAFVRSIDGCQSFEDTVIVGPTQSSTGCGASIYDAGQFSIPIVSSDGNVHVFWQGYALDSGLECTGVMTIKHSVSTDGGQTFSVEDTVLSVSGYTYANGGINTYSQPVGDVDLTGGPFDGNIYLSFTNLGDEDGSRTDVDFIRSTDGGVTWSERLQINDAEASDLIDAFHPWLICNEEGILVTVFYDQRYDPPDYLLFDLMAAYSFDGGETFTANHRISSVSSSPYSLDSYLETPAQPVFDNLQPRQLPTAPSAPMAGLIGEYIGVTAFQDKMLAVWTDSRDGNSEVYTATWQLPMLEPRLLYPQCGSIVPPQPIEFRWATSWKNDRDRYRIEISTTPDFSGSVITAQVDTNTFVLDTTFSLGHAYWRVKAFDILTGDSSACSPICDFTESSLICGDLNGDQQVDALDISYFVDWLWKGGTPPEALEVADVDGSGQADALDLLYFVEWMFLGGPDLNCW